MSIKWSQSQVNLCRQLFTSGKPVTAISAETNIPIGTVYAIVKNEIRVDPNYTWTKTQIRNRISAHDAWLCRELYKEGLKVCVIAEKMEISREVVSKIIHNKSHVIG